MDEFKHWIMQHSKTENVTEEIWFISETITISSLSFFFTDYNILWWQQNLNFKFYSKQIFLLCPCINILNRKCFFIIILRDLTALLDLF